MRPAGKKGAAVGGNLFWDGVEIRLLLLLAEVLDFRMEFLESASAGGGGGGGGGAGAALARVRAGGAEVAAGGVCGSALRAAQVALGIPHSRDCAVFASLKLTALPRYRAIMGPFHWGVWLALTLAYLFAIVPLAFSHRHTLAYLLKDPHELENMFWYVFGTFTNCFTFSGKNTWTGTRKCSTLMLIGWYWAFSIIITASYTGSIIAFVTLPVFPQVVDTSKQILESGYLVGTLGNGEWNTWFENSSDPIAEELMKKMEYLPTVFDGLRNVTSSYHPYAFLGSRSLLEYIIKVNYTPSEERRALLHLTDECFVPLGVSLAFPPHAGLAAAADAALLSLGQAGLVLKTSRDVDWALQLNGKGRLLKAAVSSNLRSVRNQEKKLSLDDIQGTFLLLGAGFAIAFFALFWECVYYIVCKCCRKYASHVTTPNTRSADMGIEASTSGFIEANTVDLGI